jgi:hypothetical protein
LKLIKYLDFLTARKKLMRIVAAFGGKPDAFSVMENAVLCRDAATTSR